MGLCVGLFEILHTLDESVNGFLGTSVVEGCAETANGAVALDTYHAA